MRRRPNRSIEVFDISLMAVVTKAMGAFLVLMLIFMPFYSSGPLGQKTVSEIAQSIAETQKDLTEAIKRIAEKASPDEIAKLLEEARRKLEEARQLIQALRRDNDALNAQVQRLENEKAQLEKQVEDMQRAIDAQKIIVSGTLVNWDCLDVRLQLALVSPGMYIERDKGQKEPYVLNYNASLGSSDATDDTGILKSNPKAASYAGGEYVRFNNSAFRFATDPGTYSLIVVKLRPQIQKIREYNGRPLMRPKEDCTVLISIQVTVPAKQQLFEDFTRNIKLPKEDYANLIFDLKVGGNEILDLVDPPQATKNWLADQITHAEKTP